MPTLLPESLIAYRPEIGLAMLVILFVAFAMERLAPVARGVAFARTPGRYYFVGIGMHSQRPGVAENHPNAKISNRGPLS